MKRIVILLIVLTQISCITQKKQNALLDGYRTELTSALGNKINTEQKVDILGESLVSMMSQSLEFKSTVKAGKFVKKFGEQNADIIQQVMNEVQNSVSDDPMSQMGFAMNLMKKPYVGELMELIPQFEKKFKRIAWVAKMTGRLAKPLGLLKGVQGGGGGLNLGDLLGGEEE